MSNRSTHLVAAAMASGGMAMYLNSNDKSPNPILDTISILFGGWIGARLPDLIDPPTSPRHRSIAHGLVQNVGVQSWAFQNLKKFRHACFEASTEYEIKAQEDKTFMGFIYQLASLVFKAIAGLYAGILAGYLSHIALDFTTPMGLPIFC